MGQDLVIAPPTDLEYAGAEVDAIVNALGAELMSDNVTFRAVVDKLSVRKWRYVFIAAHGTPDGIQLEDGLLSPSSLVQLLKANPPDLVVINTCSSLDIAVRVKEEAGVDCIGTIIDIPDRDAYVTISQLARALAKGLDVATAYHLSRPSRERLYTYQNGKLHMNGGNRQEDRDRLLLEVFKKLDRIDERMRTLEQDVRAPRRKFRPMQVVSFLGGWMFLMAPFVAFAKLDDPRFAWFVLSWILSSLCFAFTFEFISTGVHNNDGPD
jgi:hypothetical protein